MTTHNPFEEGGATPPAPPAVADEFIGRQDKPAAPEIDWTAINKKRRSMWTEKQGYSKQEKEMGALIKEHDRKIIQSLEACGLDSAKAGGETVSTKQQVSLKTLSNGHAAAQALISAGLGEYVGVNVAGLKAFLAEEMKNNNLTEQQVSAASGPLGAAAEHFDLNTYTQVTMNKSSR